MSKTNTNIQGMEEGRLLRKLGYEHIEGGLAWKMCDGKETIAVTEEMSETK